VQLTLAAERSWAEFAADPVDPLPANCFSLCTSVPVVLGPPERAQGGKSLGRALLACGKFGPHHTAECLDFSDG
jgi:hypothetical protein